MNNVEYDDINRVFSFERSTSEQSWYQFDNTRRRWMKYKVKEEPKKDIVPKEFFEL